MKDLRPSPMLLWSIRDATRRPAETLLLAAVLFCLAAWIGTVLLLNHALESAAVSRWTTAHRDLWRRRVGIAFQTSSLWPELTALENVILPMIPRARSLPTLRSLALESLDALGVSHLAGKDVRLLSGGERQRVALARALVSRPAFLFADEPTAHQDNEGVKQVLGAISSAIAWNAVVVVASQDPRVPETGRFTDRWHLAAGRIEKSG